MDFVWLVVILWIIYAVGYGIYSFIKERSLIKKLVNYNREKVLYQDYAPGLHNSFHTVLTDKRLYLISFRIAFPVFWKIKNKSVREIRYKQEKLIGTIKKLGAKVDFYIVKINNHRHLISNEKQLNLLIKKVKKINPSIKLSNKKW